jgi:hypothetical protein
MSRSPRCISAPRRRIVRDVLRFLVKTPLRWNHHGMRRFWNAWLAARSTVKRPAVGGMMGLVLLAAAVTATAGTGDGYKVSFTKADQRLARAAVLRRTDLRPTQGWSGGMTKPDLTPLTCANYHPKVSDLVVTGAAASDWSRAQPLLGYVSNSTVFQSARMLRLDWQRSMRAPGLLSCLRTALIRQGASNVAATRITFPHIAPCTAAFRFRYKVKSQGNVRLMTEVVGLCRGRTEIGLFATTSAIGQQAELSAELVRLARRLLARSAS